MESKINIVDELDKIMENLDLKESSDMASEGNSDSTSNYSQKDFTACYGDVSNSSEDEWWLGLKLYGDEETIFCLGTNGCTSNQNQVYVIINDTSEAMVTTTQSSIRKMFSKVPITWQKEKLRQPLCQERKFTLQQQSGSQSKNCQSRRSYTTKFIKRSINRVSVRPASAKEADYYRRKAKSGGDAS
jgi:hypothetical protein